MNRRAVLLDLEVVRQIQVHQIQVHHKNRVVDVVVVDAVVVSAVVVVSREREEWAVVQVEEDRADTAPDLHTLAEEVEEVRFRYRLENMEESLAAVVAIAAIVAIVVESNRDHLATEEYLHWSLHGTKELFVESVKSRVLLSDSPPLLAKDESSSHLSITFWTPIKYVLDKGSSHSSLYSFIPIKHSSEHRF